MTIITDLLIIDHLIYMFATLPYLPLVFRHLAILPASVAQLDVSSDWRPGGHGFNPR